MEIEAKFSVPDVRAAGQLQSLNALGDFILDAPVVLKMRDTFFDTPAGALSHARYVLRLRLRSDGKTFVTLKAPTEKTGAVHRRPETEVAIDLRRIPKTLARSNLPPAVLKRIAPLVGDSELHPLFSITQTRNIRVVKKGRRIIGEWSVDRVEFRAGARRHVLHELEIELKKSGTEQELKEMIKALRKQTKLKPQPRSKFARAREFYRAK